ncbi:hypothetical protein BU25DRAFT_453265 [Macroventuria anomochaeta]|uniref:Uncharacterized protein n=1 Tax=Macroventuria anomochaeta TaxID=301207 RepID=A0ACB6SHS6_9PLEO|nr:uncharacterized protein BU25DRAFT_453265 [Macroventuria anomochaeta]KAF2633512.1 hypothetical protein BU25DRAFT_453265 [Macroventuria anomochaeta]
MQWGAICEDTQVPFPCLLWEWETPQEKLSHQLALDLENLTQQHHAIFKIRFSARSTIPVFSTINSVALTAIHLACVCPAKLRRFFKHQNLTWGEKSKGVDWFLYRKFVLHGELFPYVNELQKLHPNRPIVVVEDGAPLHAKAIGICAAEYAQHHII